MRILQRKKNLHKPLAFAQAFATLVVVSSNTTTTHTDTMNQNDVIEIETGASGLRGTYTVQRATKKALLLKSEYGPLQFWVPKSVLTPIVSEVGNYVFSNWFTLPKWFRPQVIGVK